MANLHPQLTQLAELDLLSSHFDSIRLRPIYGKFLIAYQSFMNYFMLKCDSIVNIWL